jgi:hypothetical protein
MKDFDTILVIISSVHRYNGAVDIAALHVGDVVRLKSPYEDPERPYVVTRFGQDSNGRFPFLRDILNAEGEFPYWLSVYYLQKDVFLTAMGRRRLS